MGSDAAPGRLKPVPQAYPQVKLRNATLSPRRAFAFTPCRMRVSTQE